MQTFMVFHYHHDGIAYVDAYPTHGIGTDISQSLPPEIPYVFIVSPSRNQARKEGYKLWINASGKGFNKMPLRPPVLL